MGPTLAPGQGWHTHAHPPSPAAPTASLPQAGHLEEASVRQEVNRTVRGWGRAENGGWGEPRQLWGGGARCSLKLPVETFQLEDELLGPEVPEEEVPRVEPEQKPKPFPQAEPKAKQEDPKPQEYREASPQPYGDGLAKPGIRQLSMRSNSSYVSSVDEDYRSIHVQTSRHLFWVDRLIQVSEHSLQPMISMQPIQKSTKETTRGPAQRTVPKDPESSKKQSQDPSAQQGPRDKASQKTPSPEPSFCVPSMGLEELINFASTLAMASSSRMDLPSLQHMIKTTPQKTMPPPTEPTVDHAAQPTTDEPEQENLTKDEKPPEEPREAREPQDAPKQEDKDVPHPYLDLGKPGLKRATIEGELKFLQSPPTSPQPEGAAKE